MIQIILAFLFGVCLGMGVMMALVEIYFHKYPSLYSISLLMMAVLIAIVGLVAS